MNNFSQYIALFTAPAVKSSRKLFQEYGLYVFSDNPERFLKKSFTNKQLIFDLEKNLFAEQMNEV